MTLAHGPLSPAELWSSWPIDPLVVMAVVAAALLYARGALRLSRRAVRRRQVAGFYTGLLLVSIASMSPLDGLASALVSAHMVQHLIFLAIAPTLFVYGTPALVMGAALPVGVRRGWHHLSHVRVVAAGRSWATGALVATAAHITAMWLWHIPGPYEAALRDDFVHALEHGSFLITGILFWSLLVQPRARRRTGYGAGIGCAFVVWMASGGLGALLSFASRPLYPLLAANAPAWGLSALTDQQLAGVIMWVPAGAIYVVTMTTLFLRWMASLERRMTPVQAHEPLAAEARR